jgi:CRISPR type I-E-associated protein CasB/Cse2
MHDRRRDSTTGTWVDPLLGHLRRIRPRADETGAKRGDTRAFAALRASARGKRFVFPALPYVVPYLGDAYRDPSREVVDRAIALAQLYAIAPPLDQVDSFSSAEHQSPRGESMGAKLGRSNLADLDKTGVVQNGTNDEKHQPSTWERRLQALVRSDIERLIRELRGALGLIGGKPWAMTDSDYRILGYDLAWWEHPEKHVQMRWVTDFYARRSDQTESQTDQKETNDD